MGSESFLKAVARRRSIYALGKDLPCSQNEVVRLITGVARNVPSSFSGQSCRLVILFNAQHDEFWNEVKGAIRKVTADEQYAASEAKVNNCFMASAGTVLFYLDGQVVEDQSRAMPLYAKNFHGFAVQSSAMTQFAVWTALREEGIGATLQHYNELIGAKTRKMYQLPEKWELVAQMPFGSIKKDAAAKTFLPDEARFKVFGMDSKL